MNTKYLISVIVLTGSLGLFATNADAQRGHTVDCDRGDSLNDEVNRQVGHTGPVTISVTGTCEENIVIRRDDLTIDGNNNATVMGNVQNFGGRRIALSNITLTGPGLGLDNFGGEVALRNVNVTGNQGVAGVASGQNGFVAIFDSHISNNARFGVIVQRGSSVELRNTHITDHPENGVMIASNAHAQIEDGTVIQNNGNGIHAYMHSTAEILDSEISSNRFTGILISKDSGVVTHLNVDISGNLGSGVSCEDNESSFDNLEPITDSILCTNFD